MPLSTGSVEISVNENSVTVLSTDLDGKLIWNGQEYSVIANKKVEVSRK